MDSNLTDEQTRNTGTEDINLNFNDIFPTDKTVYLEIKELKHENRKENKSL